MVIQFKKYLMTLIFTVALCCGMAVSASAVQYNFEDFSGKYLSSYNSNSSPSSSYTTFPVGSVPLSYTSSITYSSGATSGNSQNTLTLDGVLIPAGTEIQLTYYFPSYTCSYVSTYSVDKSLWAYGAGNSALRVVLRSAGDVSFSNGINTPIVKRDPLFESDTFVYSYIENSSGDIIGFTVSGTLLDNLDHFSLSGTLDYSLSNPPTGYNYTSFSSYDDLTIVDLSAPPAPVYDPQIIASRYNLTATTMTSQINLSGLDPSATYRVQYSLKETDSGETVASGVSNQIGVVTDVENYTGYSRIIDLKPSTAYQIVWAVTGTSDDVIDYYDFNFTTLADGSGGGSSGEASLTDSLLLLILNKVSAILDTISGGESDGILASINEKLDALIDTLANPEEQELEDNFKDSLTEVNDNFFGDDAKGQAVTVSDVGNLANTQSTVKTIFQSDYTVSDFFGLFGDNSFFGWFSAETAMDLNPSYGSPAVADLDDPYNMDIYYENLEKVRGKK